MHKAKNYVSMISPVWMTLISGANDPGSHLALVSAPPRGQQDGNEEDDLPDGRLCGQLSDGLISSLSLGRPVPHHEM